METLLASAARTSSSTAAVTISNLQLVRSLVVQLDVTAAATDVGDLLDVYLQHSVDGTNYDDFIHFTQVLGNGGAKKYLAHWHRDVTPTTAQHAPNDGALAAGVAQGPVGCSAWRVKWVVVDAGTDDASFTFSVKAQVNYGR